MENYNKEKNIPALCYLLSALLICIIVFLFFSHTLTYSWKNYDEHIIYDETIFPIPNSFFEIFEIIRNLGLTNYFESTNPIYSDISNIRGTPIDVIYCLFIFYLFKKSAFTYHLFSLILHIINSIFCFLILSKVSSSFNLKHNFKIFIISLLTLIWALHPTNVEAILLVTNSGALVTYFICFVIFYYYLKSIHDKIKLTSFSISHLIIFSLYLFSLFLNEYSVTLPIIIFLYLLSTILITKKEEGFKDALVTSLKATSPLIFGVLLFSIYFITKPAVIIYQENIISAFQRIFWLSPQILFHYLKLIFYPVNLSVDQTAFVKFSNSLYELYGIFCLVVTYILVFISTISIFFAKKRIYYFIFLIFLPFFISLLPFLHVFSPLYNLASERYLYLPSFFLIFGFSHIIFLIFSNLNIKNFSKNTLLVTLIGFFCLVSIRSYIRTFDWKNSINLLLSTTNAAPNSLYRGLREYMIGKLIDTSDVNLKNEYLLKALGSFNQTLTELKLKEEKYQKNVPSVIKLYGLDPKTLLAKTYFLTALAEMNLTGDIKKSYAILSPHIKDIYILGPLLVDFYYKLLFNTKRYDDAEKFLKKAISQNKYRPLLLVAYSDFIEYKYNNIKLTEKYLLESFKYFPYNEATLYGLRRLYRVLSKPKQFAYFSHLYGLRTHDIASLKEAALIYIRLNNKQKAKEIIKKLIKNYPTSDQTLLVKSHYESVFGGI